MRIKVFNCVGGRPLERELFYKENCHMCKGLLFLTFFVLLSCFVSSSAIAVDPIGWWKFDESSGTTASDSSGSGNSGTLVNMTNDDWVDGRLDNALDFDGSNDYVNINAVANDFTDNDITISGWIKTTDSSGMFVACNTSDGGNRLLLAIGLSAGAGELSVYDGGIMECDTGIRVDDGDWHHLAYKRSGSTGWIYIDGIPRAVHTANFSLSSTDKWSVSQEWDGGTPSDFLDGLVDDVRIYDSTLSNDEIMVLANPELIGWWKFDEESGSTAIDSSGNGNNGTVSGSTAWITGISGGAIKFQGSGSVSIPNAAISSLSDQVTFAFWQWADPLTPDSYPSSFKTSQLTSVYSPHSGGSVYWDAAGSAGRDRIYQGVTNLKRYDGKWVHWAFTKDTGTGYMKIYLNGVELLSGSGNTKTLAGNTNLHIGSNVSSGNPAAPYLTGLIDDFRIYDIALSSDKIVDLVGGLNSLYGTNLHGREYPFPTAVLDEVEACGIEWVRIDFDWSLIETSQDNFNWTKFDALVSATQSRGARIYGTLAYTPAWATSGTADKGVPDDSDDWYDFCYEAAARYAGLINHWGMWNEPESDNMWEGTRQEYIDDILINGADAVHDANPIAMACGPETGHSSTGVTWLEDCVDQAFDVIDIVTQHMYDDDGYSGVSDRLEDDVQDALEDSNWFGNPFWLTETGRQSDSHGEAWHANDRLGLLNDWFTSGFNDRNWIDRVFFYEFYDRAAENATWGIIGVSPNYTRKEAFSACQGFIADTDDVLLWDDFDENFDQWTDGGTTDWDRSTYTNYYSGNRSAHCGSTDNDLISDNLITSDYSSMKIVFYYKVDDIGDSDDVYLKLYDGSNYDNRYEIGTAVEDQWHKYEATINNSGDDAQYFHSTFRIKFEGSSIDWGENLYIDDIKITAK